MLCFLRRTFLPREIMRCKLIACVTKLGKMIQFVLFYQLEKIGNKLVAMQWTVGQLCQALLQFSKTERKGAVFDALLDV